MCGFVLSKKYIQWHGNNNVLKNSLSEKQILQYGLVIIVEIC